MFIRIYRLRGGTFFIRVKPVNFMNCYVKLVREIISTEYSLNLRLRTFAFNCRRLIVSNRSESDIPEYRRTPILKNLLLHGTTFSIVRRGCIARSIALEVRSTLVGTRNITIIIIINLTITILISQPFYPILPDGHPTTLNFMLSLFLESRFQK